MARAPLTAIRGVGQVGQKAFAVLAFECFTLIRDVGGEFVDLGFPGVFSLQRADDFFRFGPCGDAH